MDGENLPAITIDFTVTNTINYAMQQNHVPVVRQLSVHNAGTMDLRDLNVSISSAPEFAHLWTSNLDYLKPGETYAFSPVSINISPVFLAELTERLSGGFRVTITTGGEIILEKYYPVDLLAYDQWNGAGQLPEMLAAFVTPNHPEIAGIIRSASEILEGWTGSPSFNEYQSRNPDRVRKQMAALYEAIAVKDILYCSVPASFEETGQRIRLADAIFAQRMGNCLDVSLLFAACLEAVGIHPLIILMKGHVFVGSWLIDESFAEAANDDPSLVSKRTAEGINEICIAEATCLNSGNQVSFDEAVKLAEQQMTETANFVLLLDIKRARFGGIRPLPLRVASASGWQIIEDADVARANRAPEDLLTDGKLVNVAHIETSKQQLWERKLLDLTLRNTLLNIRITKSVIQFMTVNAAKLEDALAAGKEFQVLARPNDWENSLRDAGIYKTIHAADPVAELVSHELTQQRIRTYLPENELNASLTALFRSSRLSLEENGANTLFVGIGLLKWFEGNASEKARYAPILLIPVEIVRKSAQRGYVIRNREEEAIINITLLEMLRQDFGVTIGGLDDLPKDESGVDVKKVLNIVRQAVMSRPRWDVEDQAILGNFSFNKFILWNDIHHKSDQLARNAVVASLISGTLEGEIENESSTVHLSDEKLHPAELAIPIRADSSQMAAIFNSGAGKSFVLHGPPGTGKSQTITNIIANALYNNKKVLFVSAKKAALEVVEKRLQAIGIGTFCLELHSNKSKKSDVLAQLKKATEAANGQAPANYAATAERLFAIRKELSVYVDSLHKVSVAGYSLYDFFNAYSRLIGVPDGVYFPDESIARLTRDQLTEWHDISGQMASAASIIHKPAEHPLKEIRIGAYSQLVKTEARSLIESTLQAVINVIQSLETLRPLLKINSSTLNAGQLYSLSAIARLFLQLPDSPAGFLAMDSPEQTLAQLVSLAGHGQKRDELRTALLKRFNKNILDYPAEQKLTEWHMAEGKWLLTKYFREAAIVNEVAKLSKYGKMDKAGIPELFEEIIAYQAEQQVIVQARWLLVLMGPLWLNGEPDWDNAIHVAKTYNDINHAAYQLIGVQELKNWRFSMAANFSEGSSLFIRSHEKELRTFIGLHSQLGSQCERVQQVLGVELPIMSVANESWLTTAKTALDRWLTGLEGLKDWFNYTQIRETAIASGLTPLINSLEHGTLTADQLSEGLEKGICKSTAEYLISKQPELASFNGQLFAGKIKRFREIDETFQQLTREELYSRLAGRIPAFSQEASQSSEIGILQRTLRNNGRAMPIRKLFELIPNLLPRLAPCMLMSPISVAQYFETGAAKFDLVVFDEASQMPTCEAVGAIARGNSLVVVGDPKQMPPTNFFTTNNIDEDNILKEDLESILDDCLALSMPQHHLRWHYRSKHESLIAFSNAMYYDNKLFTFPSTDDLSSRVQLVKVKGTYDKGKTRQNRLEAQAIVDHIIYRLSTPSLSTRSVGVVTFSTPQQALIEDLLTEVFALRPDLEKTAYETEEPLFIKNLENVQGDERDVILFSIGYGPDENGRVSLNFGPINREGGWRRLNVAVSRARYEMKVFSTLASEQIDLNRTSSEGAAGLKAFLAYAEKGRRALPLPANNGVKMEEPGLEEAIAAELRTHGYKVNTRIGTSSFKIDLGIVNPEQPDHYLLAILLDGKSYYHARATADREIIQPDVLNGLGWRIMKVWSTEWWEDKAKVLHSILEAIKQAGQGKTPIKEDTVETVPQDEPLNYNYTALPKLIAGDDHHPYLASRVAVILSKWGEEFFTAQHRPTIMIQIRQVVAVESPVSKDLLLKRVLTGWGSPRLTARIGGHLELLVRELGIPQTTEFGRTFFWNTVHQANTYTEYRTTIDDSIRRDAEDLPVQEIANGVKAILKNQISLNKTDLVKEAARLFGYGRLGANVELAMLNGIQHALFNGFATMNGERVVGV
jgi:very-short-patch-repair endonuclease